VQHFIFWNVGLRTLLPFDLRTRVAAPLGIADVRGGLRTDRTLVMPKALFAQLDSPNPPKRDPAVAADSQKKKRKPSAKAVGAPY